MFQAGEPSNGDFTNMTYDLAAAEGLNVSRVSSYAMPNNGVFGGIKEFGGVGSAGACIVITKVGVCCALSIPNSFNCNEANLSTRTFQSTITTAAVHTHFVPGILLLLRWFLATCIADNNLQSEYDWFVITRSDYLYLCEHLKVGLHESRWRFVLY